jgi:hypothetical protein
VTYCLEVQVDHAGPTKEIKMAVADWQRKFSGVGCLGNSSRIIQTTNAIRFVSKAAQEQAQVLPTDVVCSTSHVIWTKDQSNMKEDTAAGLLGTWIEKTDAVGPLPSASQARTKRTIGNCLIDTTCMDRRQGRHTHES